MHSHNRNRRYGAPTGNMREAMLLHVQAQEELARAFLTPWQRFLDGVMYGCGAGIVVIAVYFCDLIIEDIVREPEGQQVAWGAR
jgi:hypothetical protein